MDRRAFCVSSASGALALAAFRAPAAVRLAQVALPPASRTVLIDSRFAPARAFGATAARAGAAVFDFQGDLTSVWLRRLRPHWRVDGGPIAGVTSVAGLFCLEQLAKDHWLRVVSRTSVAGHSEPLMAWVIARS